MKRFVFKEAKLLALRKQQVTLAELAVSAAKSREQTLLNEVERASSEIVRPPFIVG